MYVEIITPEKMLHAGEARLIQLPGENGLFEILDNHAPIISSLRKGLVKVIDTNNGKSFYNISGGVIECISNKVIVLVGDGEHASGE